mgnify:CR=1 FL=1
MRLMQIIAAGYVGGAQGFFERLVPALADAGVEQRLAIHSGMKCIDSLSATDIPLSQHRFGGRMNGRFNFSTRRALRDVAAQFRPDVTLAWQSGAVGLAPRKPGVLVGRLGGYEKMKHYKHCQHLVVNAPGIRDYILSNGWSGDRVHLISNFVSVDLGRAEPRDAHSTPNDAPLLFAAGRFHSHKAFDILLESLVRLPGAYLWIAGDGDDAAALKSHAAALKVDDRVRWLGWRDDIGALLNACDIFVSSARNEPLGNAVLEAMSAAKPIVAAPAFGPAGLIEDGQNGRLVPIDDSEALADTIGELIANPTLASELAAQGLKTYERNHSKAQIVEEYLTFFNRIAG